MKKKMKSTGRHLCILALMLAAMVALSGANPTLASARQSATSGGHARAQAAAIEEPAAATTTSTSDTSPTTGGHMLKSTPPTTGGTHPDELASVASVASVADVADVGDVVVDEVLLLQAEVTEQDVMAAEEASQAPTTTTAVAAEATTLAPASPVGERAASMATTAAATTMSGAGHRLPNPRIIQGNFGIQLEGKPTNGLYRIKLAEVLPGGTSSTTEPAPAPALVEALSTPPVPHGDAGTDDYLADAPQPAADSVSNSNSNNNKGPNIIDLQPQDAAASGDFGPLLRDSNAKLLKEHAIFVRLDAAEHRQNLMPNEVSDVGVTHPQVTAKPAPAVSEFTGKLLAEQDGIITEIEQKFRLDEFAVTPSAATRSVNRKRAQLAAGGAHDFIDRRVKKSFEFPMHRAASDAMSLPHIDFANTKFSTETAVNPPAKTHASVNASPPNLAAGAHPEFSTTKFYNSKELYNEMMQHNRQKLRAESKTRPAVTISPAAQQPTGSEIADSLAANAPHLVSAGLGWAGQHAAFKLPTLSGTSQPPAGAKSHVNSIIGTTPRAVVASEIRHTDLQAAVTSAGDASDGSSRPATTTSRTTPTSSHMAPATHSMATSTAMPTPAPMPLARTSPTTTSTTTTTTTTTTTAAAAETSTTRPIARPRIRSRLQERINALECEIPNVPPDSHLWRGNETHELMLPIMTSGECKTNTNCAPARMTWDGEAEIQSGDILIVEINDALLNAHIGQEAATTSSAHNTQVYQVTRSGHEHCDVTEGILLDITPLVVDGRKLVTLYDKDLTEGVNLLIVVSELWGAQCVRLKVTTKTDNCGENADCSAKGICYSNPSMEGYECQCCSGFAGPHCEEIDACTPSPCTNNGICVDLSQGHDGNDYQCLCPYGYTGKNCQYESDPCNPAECMNGGSCVGNSTHFRCDCTSGYSGAQCQNIVHLNECESSPCVHGICVDQEDGFRCFCQPGFAGELCNFEYNECESNPCQNDGECIDDIGRYECRCTKGYTGARCHMKVDFCANKPCPEGRHCVDHGNDFSCECPGGSNGPECNPMPRTQCNVNPCTHGGTCWSSGDSFYCACRAGYTGTMCEDEFVVETVVSSSEFIVDDTSMRNFNDKTFGSSVVLKSPIELHNAYFAAGVLAAAIFIVAIVVTICHCKVNQTYRKFSTRSTSFFPILGFARRPKASGKLNKHWLSGKGLGSSTSSMRNHLPSSSSPHQHNGGGVSGGSNGSGASAHNHQHSATSAAAAGGGAQLYERPFQRHLAMNLENDMYYTVDFSENSQHSPLIQ